MSVEAVAIRGSTSRESLNNAGDGGYVESASGGAFPGFLPMLLQSEEDADQQLEDSVLHARLRDMPPPELRKDGEADGDVASPSHETDTRQSASLLDSNLNDGSRSFTMPSQKSSVPTVQDSSLDVMKQKWTLLLDRLEFEVFMNK